jgi:hypothetical protein
MDANLILGIYEGTVDIDSLTDEQQEQVLRDYQTLAEHWVDSPKEGQAELGKEILVLLEESKIYLQALDSAMGNISH